MTQPEPKCNRVGCEKTATWIFEGQWPTCDDHVDEAEKLLQENVRCTIIRSRIGDLNTRTRPAPQPPEMKTFVIWDFELEELTYGDRLDTKKRLNKDVRSRPHPSHTSARAQQRFIRESFMTLHGNQLFTASQVADLIEKALLQAGDQHE